MSQNTLLEMVSLFKMVSVERIQNYIRLEQEAPAHTDKALPGGWPENGDIRFKHVQLNYRGAGRHALHDVNLTITSNEKVFCKHLIYYFT